VIRKKKTQFLNSIERFYAKQRLYEEVIVFVHFFGGTKRHLKAHIDWVNELGFDAVAFNLTFHPQYFVDKPPITSKGQWGLKHIWAKEIEQVLQFVTRPKIVFSFSNPTACAIEAIVSHGTKDIVAMVADSGPFAPMWKSNWNYLFKKLFAHSFPKRVFGAVTLSLVWSINHSLSLKQDISRLPTGFPILSVRGWKDRLVPTELIDNTFKEHDQIDLEVFALPEADHLSGLKDFRDEYNIRVGGFLKRIATAKKAEIPEESQLDQNCQV
jgi:hypothetical protein